MKTRLLSTLLALSVITMPACTATRWESRFYEAEEFNEGMTQQAPFLKLHGHAGELWLFNVWEFDADRQVVMGTGVSFDDTRGPHGEGVFEVPIADIALIETNQPETVFRTSMVILGVTGALTATLTTLCVIGDGCYY